MSWSDAVVVTNDGTFAGEVNQHARILATGRPERVAASPLRFLRALRSP
jgi:hypothetical protein